MTDQWSTADEPAASTVDTWSTQPAVAAGSAGPLGATGSTGSFGTMDSTGSVGMDDATGSVGVGSSGSFDTMESTGSIDDTDQTIEETIAEIEQTRQEMTGTVEAIGDRLAPKNVMKDATQAVKEATVGKVEDMASQASGFIGGATSSAQGAGGGVIETIKSNPIPALMTGVGLAWLFRSFSSSSSSSSRKPSWDQERMSSYGMGSYGEYRPLSSSGSSGPGQVLDTVGEKVGAVGDRFSGAGETVGNKVSGVGDTVGNTVSGVGETVGSAASQVTGGVGSAAGQVGDKARNVAGSAKTVAGSATQVIGENALAAGAIAVAAGAAIGLILPSTEMERNIMGDAGSKAIDTAKSTVTDTLSKAEGAPA
jgi:phage-related protein